MTKYVHSNDNCRVSIHPDEGGSTEGALFVLVELIEFCSCREHSEWVEVDSVHDIEWTADALIESYMLFTQYREVYLK